MRARRLAPWIAIAWLTATVDASPDLVAERAVVVGRVDGGAWTDAPTEARADQKAELAAGGRPPGQAAPGAWHGRAVRAPRALAAWQAE